MADGGEVRVTTVHDESRSQLGLPVRGAAATEIELDGIAEPAQVLTAHSPAHSSSCTSTRAAACSTGKGTSAIHFELQAAPRTPASAPEPQSARGGKGD